MLLSLAQGQTLKQAAAENGYKSFEAISRISARPESQRELLRLRDEASLALAESLPELVAQAIGVLQTMLASGNYSARRDASFFVLRHLGRPLVQVPSINANATDTALEGSLIAPDTDHRTP